MRQTKNKNLKKQILTLMLAFVMVFTGMGIGSWGVDEAWADEVNVYKIDLSEHQNQVGTYTIDEVAYPVYEVFVGAQYDAFVLKKNVITMDDGYRWPFNVFTAVTGGSGGTTNEDGDIAIDETVMTEAEKFYDSAKTIIEFSAGRDVSTENRSLLFRIPAGKGIKRKKIVAFLVINIQKETEIVVDEKTLVDEIRKAEQLKKNDYYLDTAKYNGKEYSDNGFWEKMEFTLDETKKLFVESNVEKGLLDVTEEQLAKAYKKLKRSIENLIPVTEANTTVLYEALQDCPKINESFSYNAESLKTFMEKQTEAKNLLASLFLNGEATEANTPAKQDEIDRVAAELRDSYSGDKMDAEISTQEELTNFLTRAGSGIKGKLLTDITLSGYKRVTSFYGALDGNGHAIIIDNAYLGLVGTNHGVIQNITVRGADLESGAAICNTNNGLIENCHNSVNFIGKEKGSYAICSSNAKTGIIRNCYNTGKLSGTYVGGICGTNLGLVENCFNTGLIDAESNAGGIVWRNHNNSESNGIGGKIRNCYNFNVMHHTAGWGSIYGSYIYNNLGPICGDNERSSVSISATSSKNIYIEGTVENGLYLDTVISNKPNGRPLSIALSDIYLAQKKAYDNLGTGTSAGTAIAGWTEKDRANSIFAYGTDYYVFYDNTNGHFIAVTFDDAATSAVIDAAKPSAQSELCKSAAGAEKEFYLVKVPTGTKAVTFKNTEMIIDYANGYTNRYVKAYQQHDNFGVNFRPELSRKFVGTAIASSDVSTILSKVSAICGSDTATVAFVKEMLSGIEAQGSTVTPTEKDIKVKFRFVGATKSPSGNYDAKTNKDSQYVTWIATRTYSLKDGSSVGDLLMLAIKESGIKTVGEENNYVSGVYAPNVLGNYYLAEFTNGTRSGWMYTVNGKHPGVGLNGYYLKDGDSVIWHYINDYSYEVSDWFDDPDYPNLGNASTWDPWLKVSDVDPTKDTPTVGGGVVEEVKDVTTDTKTGTTTAPTEVKVSEKTNADGTKTKVADVKVSADNQKEILKQAKASKSKEIILNVSKAAVGDAAKADVTLDKSFIDSIVKDTNAKLTIKTPFGDKTYTQDELKAMSEAATGSTVTVAIEKAAEPTDDAAAKIEKAKSIVKDMKLVARSSKTAKKNIKAVLKSDAKVNASIRELKDLGFTVKYRFYRSTKKAASYKAAVTKKTAAYTNTSGKKGTKYFYKVQVRAYDENGKLVAKTALKQCKYASRTWTK